MGGVRTCLTGAQSTEGGRESLHPRPFLREDSHPCTLTTPEHLSAGLGVRWSNLATVGYISRPRDRHGVENWRPIRLVSMPLFEGLGGHRAGLGFG